MSKNWVEISECDLFEMFGDYVVTADKKFEENIKNEKYDYSIFNREYYEKKFPGFEDNIYEILSKISKEKMEKILNNKSSCLERCAEVSESI